MSRHRMVLALILMAPLLSACTRASDPVNDAVVERVERHTTKLTGKWQFFWNEFVPAATENHTRPGWARVPGEWKGLAAPSGTATAKGFATYRLTIMDTSNCPCRVHLPVVGTAHRLFAGTKLIARSGLVGSGPETNTPFFRPQISAPFEGKGPLLLTWHIANFEDRSGGPWQAPRIGSSESIERYRENQIALDLFLAGALLLMGLYHGGLFLVRRTDRAPFFFGIFCLLMVVRSLTEGEKFLFERLPNLDWRTQVQISYATFYVSVPIFLRYYCSIFPGWLATLQMRMSAVVFGALLVLVIFTPVSVFSETLPLAHLLTGALIAVSLGITIRATLRQTPGGWPFLLGVMVFGSAVVHDILLAYSLVEDSVYAPFGFFFFIFSQAFLLSARFSRALQAEEDLTRELRESAEAMRRFVPSQFLQILGRPNLTAVEAGDQVARRMTILFSDIRSFTQLSEAMTPAETFNFLNSYMRRMEPSIHRFEGFIDKYMGDGIMALFPPEPGRAIQAAIDMQRNIEVFNGHRRNSGYRPIAVGIGVHVGELMLGMIGSRRRLDGTVISDAVNLASRLQEFTRTFGAQILISEDVFIGLPDPDRFKYRVLGSLSVRGKSRRVTIIEILDGMSRERRAYLLATKSIFEKGCHALARDEPVMALRYFQEALAECPDDSAARYYVELLSDETHGNPHPGK